MKKEFSFSFLRLKLFFPFNFINNFLSKFYLISLCHVPLMTLSYKAFEYGLNGTRSVAKRYCYIAEQESNKRKSRQ